MHLPNSPVPVVLEQVCIGKGVLRDFVDVEVQCVLQHAGIYHPWAFQVYRCCKYFVQVVAEGADVTLILKAGLQ